MVVTVFVVVSIMSFVICHTVLIFVSYQNFDEAEYEDYPTRYYCQSQQVKIIPLNGILPRYYLLLLLPLFVDETTENRNIKITFTIVLVAIFMIYVAYNIIYVSLSLPP